MALDIEETTYEDFRDEWVSEIEGSSNTVEKGRAFAIKLAREWLDVDPNDDEFVFADGAGDGGIDIAYLQQDSDDSSVPNDGDSSDDTVGDTWFIFQSKYGSAIRGSQTVVNEAQKVFDTILDRNRLSSEAESVAERIRNFCKQDSQGRDRIVLVIASVDPLGPDQARQIDEVRKIGAAILPKNGPTFDIESATVRSIFDKVNSPPDDTVLKIRGQFSDLGSDAKVGTVSLLDLHEFLKSYRTETGELDRLYEKNVRRWLGMRKSGKVNWGIKTTLENEPERFGLYNNGITFVAKHFDNYGDMNNWVVTNPYIVNGCQTTRTLFEVVSRRLESGGTGVDHDRDQWRDKLRKSAVVVKIVTSNISDEVRNITLFTNTQSAVRGRDLVALDDDYNQWKIETQQRFVRYLEIQRGGWNSRKTYEKQHPDATPRFTSVPNATPIIANDMLKVFGAGWLGYAGTAGRRSADFLPAAQTGGGAGKVFGEIGNLESFGSEDIVAADHLFAWGKAAKFGARGSKINRSQTRYLFYHTYVQLMRSLLGNLISPEKVPTHLISRATLKLVNNESSFDSMCETAKDVIDKYVNEREDAPFRKDPGYREASNLVSFLQSTRLDAENIDRKAPEYVNLLGQTIAGMDMSFGGAKSFAEGYRQILKDLIV